MKIGQVKVGPKMFEAFRTVYRSHGHTSCKAGLVKTFGVSVIARLEKAGLIRSFHHEEIGAECVQISNYIRDALKAFKFAQVSVCDADRIGVSREEHAAVVDAYKQVRKVTSQVIGFNVLDF